VKPLVKQNGVDLGKLQRPKINIKAPLPTPGTDTLRIATLKINGLSSVTRQAMMENFIRLHDLDLVYLQEVTHQFTTPFSGYAIHYNIGSTLIATNIYRLLSGRAMAVNWGNLLCQHIRPRSGTSKRLERETFFNNDLPYLLNMASGDILLGGDFNCVLDAGGHHWARILSHSLSTLIHGYSLRDAWQTRPDNTAHTHYTTYGATRLDRLYLTEGLLRRKTGVATVAAAFTDHLAVVLRLSMSAPFYGGDEEPGNYKATNSPLRTQWRTSTITGRNGKNICIQT
jgi:endonuclease/exonuclease/phosphatase family metal-dependent hydrolase